MFDVYLDCCQDSFSKVLSSELRNIFSDGLNNGRNLGIQNKQRGAVVLRKTMDKVLSELDKVRLTLLLLLFEVLKCDDILNTLSLMFLGCFLDVDSYSMMLMLTPNMHISRISELRKKMK